MSDAALLLVVTLALVVVLAAFGALAAVVLARHRRHIEEQERRLAGISTEQATRFSQIANEQERLIRAVGPLFARDEPHDNVISRLTFAESFDAAQYAAAAEESSLRQIAERMAPLAGDGAVVTIQGLRLARSGAEMTFEISKNGQQLLRNGVARFARHRSGRILPVIKDAGTGKTIEMLKGAPAAKTLSRLGALSAMVVGAAHIVSGADVAKRIKIVDKKLDLLIACRRIDQLAKLERIYSSAKELVHGPLDREKRWELWRLRGELRELRYAWRHELKHHLELIDDPTKAGWFKKTFSLTKTSDREIHGQITEGQLQLGLIEYSMRLDQVLAVGGDTVPEYEKTLAAELVELDKVSEVLEEKAGLISKRYPDLTVGPVVEGMKSILREYASLLPAELMPAKLQPLLPEDSGSSHDSIETVNGVG